MWLLRAKLLASFVEESPASRREIWNYALASSMAPEVIVGQMWDQSADCWSLGVLVCKSKDDMLMSEVCRAFHDSFHIICRYWDRE